MYNYFLAILFVASFLCTSSVEAQWVRPESRVVNGKIVTDYHYEYLPGEPSRGRAYREHGKIKYEPIRPSPNYYDPRDSGREPNEGMPYRDRSGKIRYR